MRKFYLLTFLLSASSLLAQEKKLKRADLRQFEFTEVVKVDSLPAAQLYFNSKLFLSNVFLHVKETAQIKDDKALTVATKASFPVTIENGAGDEIKAKTFFTLLIQAKESMYKYSLFDFYFAYTEETGVTSYASFNDRMGVAMTKKQWQQVEEQSEIFARNFALELKEHMLQNEILCKELLQAKKKKKKEKSEN